MSLFKEPFSEEIKDSLDIRQEIIGKDTRTPKELAFLNSKTSWVSLKSAVNVDGNSNLAKRNILEGGNLFLGKPKFGVSNNITSAYSTKNTSGENNVLGIRPMPGITSVNISNLGAYGSTRKAIVEFQCWDIKQLEILEQLYMRPGYLVLLEFGRSIYPKRKTDGSIDITQLDRDINYDFFSKQNINLLEELDELHKLSVKSKGNYDAFLGYVVNYGWELRNDGGYDCKTEIISTGEVLQSLKVNYSLAQITDFSTIGSSFVFKGLILPRIIKDNLDEKYQILIDDVLENRKFKDDVIRINQKYAENVISGLTTELQFILKNVLYRFNKFSIKNNEKTININTSYAYYQSDEGPYEQFLNGGFYNGYITLESFVELLNEFIIPYSFQEAQDGSQIKGTITKLSTKDRGYLGKGNEDLKCLFNNLMTSVNPDICIIKNEEWVKVMKGIKISQNVVPPKFPNDAYLNHPESTKLRGKIVGYVNSLANKETNAKLNILENIDQDRINWIQAGLPEYDFYNQFQRNYQIVRGVKISETIIIGNAPVDAEALLFSQMFPAQERNRSTTIEKREWNLIFDKSAKQSLRNNYSKDLTFYTLLIENQNTSLNPFKAQYNAVENQKVKFDKRQNIKNVLENLRITGVDSSLDGYFETQRELVTQAEEDAKNLEETNNALKQSGENFEKFINGFEQNFIFPSEGNNRKLGIIGNIYLNLKFLNSLSNDPSLADQDTSGKKNIYLFNYIENILNRVQGAIGNINNFELFIDDRDGIGRIIDLNITNPYQRANFKFNIGNKNTIIRDLKLESKIFNDQINMIAISAQSSTGRLGVENSSLTAYNRGITDRLLPKKDVLPVFNTSEDAKISNTISSLSNLTNNFFKSWMEKYYSPKIVKTDNSVDSSDTSSHFFYNKAAGFESQLRDIISFFTAYYNPDNKLSMIIPTSISFTMDGLSGIVIGNLFSLDDTFVPSSYKQGDKSLGYIVKNVGHSLQNNDWITNIEGLYYVIGNSNENITNPTNFNLVVNYNTNTGDREVKPLNLTPSTSFADNVRKINNKYIISEDKQVDNNFEPLILKIFERLNKEVPDISIVITSAKDDRGGTSKHNVGNAVDFQITGINSSNTGYQSRINTFTNTLLSSKEYELWYNKDQKELIDKVDNVIRSFSTATLISSYNLIVDGTSLTYVNEYYYPSAGATGPHFHIQTTL